MMPYIIPLLNGIVIGIGTWLVVKPNSGWEFALTCAVNIFIIVTAYAIRDWLHLI